MCCNCDQGERYPVGAPTDDNHNDSRLFHCTLEKISRAYYYVQQIESDIIMEYLAWGVQAKTHTLIPWPI